MWYIQLLFILGIGNHDRKIVKACPESHSDLEAIQWAAWLGHDKLCPFSPSLAWLILEA